MADCPVSGLTTAATFAGDAAILSPYADPKLTSLHLELHLREVEKWLQLWRMKVNELNCVQIMFTLRKGSSYRCDDRTISRQAGYGATGTLPPRHLFVGALPFEIHSNCKLWCHLLHSFFLVTQAQIFIEQQRRPSQILTVSPKLSENWQVIVNILMISRHLWMFRVYEFTSSYGNRLNSPVIFWFICRPCDHHIPSYGR